MRFCCGMPVLAGDARSFLVLRCSAGVIYVKPNKLLSTLLHSSAGVMLLPVCLSVFLTHLALAVASGERSS